MPRTRRTHPAIDPIRTNAGALRDYVRNGEACLGIHPRDRLQSFRVQLKNLKAYAYDHVINDEDPDGTCARVWLIMQDAELDYIRVKDGDFGVQQVQVFWRPNRIATERAKMGLETQLRTPEEWQEIENAKKLFLARV